MISGSQPAATPIAAPGVSDFQTIESPTNVAFLNPPMTIGTVLVEAPRRAIRQGEYFMARFLAHSGWKRASFLALTAEEAPKMRDIVTLRMLADPQDAPQRAHPARADRAEAAVARPPGHEPAAATPRSR